MKIIGLETSVLGNYNPTNFFPSASKQSSSVIFKRAAATAAAAIHLVWPSRSLFFLSRVCNGDLFALRSRSFFCLSCVCNDVSFALRFFCFQRPNSRLLPLGLLCFALYHTFQISENIKNIMKKKLNCDQNGTPLLCHPPLLRQGQPENSSQSQQHRVKFKIIFFSVNFWHFLKVRGWNERTQ